MKRFISVFLILISFIGINAQSQKFLFIGNSYTSVNNLPAIVQQIYNSTGESVSVTSMAPGGYTFQQHCTYSMDEIQSGGYDYVILQEQSQLPSFPENQFMQESYPYAQQLCNAVRLYNPDAKIAFYMTWGRKNGDAQNCIYYPPLCTYEGMDSLLYARYMMMAQDNHVCVSPVGAAWHFVRDHYPEIELYQSDESHPAYVGSYIAACCFYSLFTGRNPLDIHWNGSLDDSMAFKAKMAVKTVVYDSLSKWCFEADTTQIDSTGVSSYGITKSSITVYPNPAQNNLRWSVNPDVEVKTLSVYDLQGRLLFKICAPKSEEIDVSNLECGLYLLEVFDGKRSYKTKFSIVR